MHSHGRVTRDSILESVCAAHGDLAYEADISLTLDWVLLLFVVAIYDVDDLVDLVVSQHQVAHFLLSLEPVLVLVVAHGLRENEFAVNALGGVHLE